MKVLLHNKELWEKFKEHQTEMNITKEGRRMCPVISLAFEDLNPKQMYAVMVDFVFADEFRYCFDSSSNRWKPWGEINEEASQRMYLHPHTPTTGAALMKSALTFQKLKLTNSFQSAWNSKQLMLLNTMRRYFPRIFVLESPDGASFDHRLRKEFCFPETDFIAVSAYRNKQITQLKIDANPFASAYRSNGLHGQAKRRKMESMSALKQWNATFEDDPPSNSSSLEESSNNGEETDFENTNCSSNELVSTTAPVQSYDEQQLDGIRAAIPFLKDRLRRDVSFFVYNPIYNEALSEESVENLPQSTENHPTDQLSNISVSESQLTCEETAEWMWGFDEQISLRCSPERPELEAFLPKKADNSENAAKNRDEASDEHKQGGDAGKAMENRHGASVADRGPTNRRKKYLPRKLQRTGDIPLQVAFSKANKEGIQLQENELAINQVDEKGIQLQENEPATNQVDEEGNQLQENEPATNQVDEEGNQLQENEPATNQVDEEGNQLQENEPATNQVDEEGNQLQENEPATNQVDEEGNQLQENEPATNQVDEEGNQPQENEPATNQVDEEGNQLQENEPAPNQVDEKGIQLQANEPAINQVDEKDIQLQENEPAINQVDVLSTQSHGTKCDGEDIEERMGSYIATTLDSSEVTLPCVEADKTPRSQSTAIFQDQNSVLSRVRTGADSSVTGQDDSPLPLKTSDETSESRHDTSLMWLSSTPEMTTESSLTALIQMCSQAEGTLTQESTTESRPSFCGSFPLDVQVSGSWSSSDGVDTVSALGSELKERANLPCTSTSSSSTLSIPTVTFTSVSESSEISHRCDTLDKLSTATDPFQAAFTSKKASSGDRFLVDSLSDHVFLGEFSGGQPSGKKHPGYRPIVPAPNQSVDVSTVEPATGVFQESGSDNNNTLYPIIVDSFSLTENIQYSFAQLPQVNQSHFAAPNSYQTGLTSHTGFIALDKTVAVQALSLEKFYSFSAPNKYEREVRRSRLEGSRYYKTTRTNFSRLSLEPVCSVIYPLTNCTQSTCQGNPASKESVTEDAAHDQRTWGWPIN